MGGHALLRPNEPGNKGPFTVLLAVPVTVYHNGLYCAVMFITTGSLFIMGIHFS
jgi:hypothetical protein